MTIAKRIAAIIPCDDAGKPRHKFHKGGLDADYIEIIAAFLDKDGADEIWLRLDPSIAAVGRGPNALYSPLSVLEKRVFLPIVAWAPIPSGADARLLLGFGAERIVVDAALGLPDPIGHVGRICQIVGPDRVVAALSVRRSVGDKGIVWELVDNNGEGSGLDAIAVAERLPAAGACELLVVPQVRAPGSDRRVHDGELLEQVAASLSVPLWSAADDKDAADLATPLLMGADGVATSLFASGAPSIAETKRALTEYGVAVRPVDNG